MYKTTGQIHRTNAPSATHMAMPAHLEALIHKPIKRIRKPIAAPVVERPPERQSEMAKRLKKAKSEISAFKAMQNKLDIARWNQSRRVKIAELVCYVCGVDFIDLLTEDRRPAIVRVRHILMWMLRKHCKGPDGRKISMPAIGRFLSRDHSTVVHAIRKCETHPKLKQDASEIERLVLTMERAGFGTN